MVAHLVWDQGVAGSSPVIPTKFRTMKKFWKEVLFAFSQDMKVEVMTYCGKVTSI
jgi:hypothetical protein